MVRATSRSLSCPAAAFPLPSTALRCSDIFSVCFSLVWGRRASDYSYRCTIAQALPRAALFSIPGVPPRISLTAQCFRHACPLLFPFRVVRLPVLLPKGACVNFKNLLDYLVNALDVLPELHSVKRGCRCFLNRSEFPTVEYLFREDVRFEIKVECVLGEVPEVLQTGVIDQPR